MEQEGEIEIPQYFLCPISLQIMKDPVTTITGITYDRDTISRWLTTATKPVCPVTKQPFPVDSDLTPNHTLRRLIQAWCVTNASHGVERIPTPKAPLSRAHLIKIVRDLNVPHLRLTSLDRLLAISATQDRKLLVDPSIGVSKAISSLIVKCYNENQTAGLEQALRILTGIWSPAASETENFIFMNAVIWVLSSNNMLLRTLALLLTKEVIKVASLNLIERLNSQFYQTLVKIVRQRGGPSPTGTTQVKSVLRILLEISYHGRNRQHIIESGAIFELIELELEMSLTQQPERKKLTDLGMSLLAQLCSCANGRAQFLAHAAGIALVTKRILRVSDTVDDTGVQIFAQICKFSATKKVLQEMLRVGAVSKLCMILQADCPKYLKDKVSEILRMHSHGWNKSPCIQVYLLTRYPIMGF